MKFVEGITWMFESCVEIRTHCSDYLDGECTAESLRSIRFHLNYCAACRDEFSRQEMVQADLHALPRCPVPPELGLRLRVRLSQHLHRNLLDRVRVRIENGLQPMLLPASAGVLTAVICFGLMLASGVPPASRIPDVPFQITTPPRVRTLAPLNFPTDDEPVVLVTYIDAVGRVKDYKLLSGQVSPELTRRLDRMLLFSRFQPATTRGRPTEGRMVLSLRRITVRG